jgi:MoaA/NifB/PqqE/SkfB family radical SAM enzyme
MRWLRDFQERTEKEHVRNAHPARRHLLQWHITDRCDLRCSHCYQETYSDPELNLSQLLSIVDQYDKFLKK